MFDFHVQHLADTSDLGVTKQKLNFHSVLSFNLHENYTTRDELRKQREETMTAPALDGELIPVLLDYVVNEKPVQKDPLPPQKQPSNDSARLMSFRNGNKN